MRRVLFVDDDPLITRIYKTALEREGLKVFTADDGIAALKSMQLDKPDVVVLDLMMPRLSGADVLKLMHQQPQLASLPVIVLSNSYVSEVTTDAAQAGAQKGLLKVSCTPSLLIRAIEEVVEGKEAGPDTSGLLAVAEPLPKPAPRPPEQREPARPEPPARPSGRAPKPAVEVETQADRDARLRLQIRGQFLQNGPTTCAGLRASFKEFSVLPPSDQRNLRLQDLYRRVHFLTASAGLSDCARLAQMATAFEALLFRLMDDPGRITNSALRTVAAAIDYVEVLFGEAREGKLGVDVAGHVLVVDDDPVSNRLVVWALTQAGLQATSSDDPQRAFQLLNQQPFDLVLLDVQMPGMDGFEFCRRARQLPAYATLPFIFVTAHGDFESRAKSVLAGGNDLIGKPVLPMEVSVKAVMHLLKSHVPAAGGGAESAAAAS